jgi:hypothetical protein
MAGSFDGGVVYKVGQFHRLNSPEARWLVWSARGERTFAQ